MTFSTGLALALAVAALSGCVDVEEQTYPSPDGELILVQRLAMGGGAAGWSENRIIIRSRGGEELEIYRGKSGFGYAEWLTDHGVQYCAPSLPQGVRHGSVAGKTVTITNWCPEPEEQMP